MVRKITPSSGGWGKRSGIDDTTRDFEKAASRALISAPWSRDAWGDELCQRLTQQLIARRRLPPALTVAVRRAVGTIVQLETQALRIPEAVSTQPAEAVAHRARLRGLIHLKEHPELLHQWAEALGQMLGRIVDAVPNNLLLETSPFTVPLIDVIPEAPELVSALVEKYGIDQERAASDVSAFLADLRGRELLER